MKDKSPRQDPVRKAAKSLKQKRADKRAKRAVTALGEPIERKRRTSKG